jgi:hypothetical protein
MTTYIVLTQVAKNQFYGKYSIQTMIFWSLCAFIWFKNIEKMLLQMKSGFLQQHFYGIRHLKLL